MRVINHWRKTLVNDLKSHWRDDFRLNRGSFCDIELGLYLLEQMLPHEPAISVWALLTGYEYSNHTWTDEQTRALLIARTLLPMYRAPFPWQRALEQYQQINAQLRGYDVGNPHQPAHRRGVMLATNRWNVYARALEQEPIFRSKPVVWANAGTYTFPIHQKQATVTIPPDLEPSELPQYANTINERCSIQVDFAQLYATAAWMDAHVAPNLARNWQQRIERVKLEIFNTERTDLVETSQLTLDGMIHIVGMVSAGKSTLMEVLAVWLAQQGKHVTLVVGDVLSALNLAQTFVSCGIASAPILGNSGRERHLVRQHRAHHDTPFVELTDQFRWLSTACWLDGLRDTAEPLGITRRPCLQLTPAGAEQNDREQSKACPFFGNCSYHQAQHDASNASIWIATPASLIFTRVAPQLQHNHMRFAEMIIRHSDVIIIDEADRVQIQLDSIFSPSQALVSRTTDAWLNQVQQQVTRQLIREGRSQLSDPHVARWIQAHEVVQLAANRVYAMLLQSKHLQQYVEQNYFTAWLIFDEIAQRLTNSTGQPYTQLMDIFTACVDDPFGERENHSLLTIVQNAITQVEYDRVRALVLEWLAPYAHATIKSQTLDKLAELGEFAIHCVVLSNRLDLLIRDWNHVETILELEQANFFQSPPDDYAGEVPAAPMGNVLAFQYLQSDEQDAAGTLRFFRCMGVGRWFLLNLNQRFLYNHQSTPHVLLLSATSWAGNAPNYDIQLPITGILSAPATEIAAIEASYFEYMPVLDKHSNPIRVSGLQGDQRMRALDAMLHQLTRHGTLDPSRLEQIRDSLPANRQRMLLLVGSYDEALHVRHALDRLRPDWAGQIVHLVADDDRFETTWTDGLQRGMVSTFAQRDAWILIAPLLAVERGHNILNTEQHAALGAVMFLIRPHPRPDDLMFAISSINRWAISSAPVKYPATTFHTTALQFRHAAYREWQRLIRLPMRYITLPKDDHSAITWSLLVSMWQVIGRLVRGGVPAHVMFCDAAFATFAAESSQRNASLLLSMVDLLAPYFDAEGTVSAQDRAIVRRLYSPLFYALSQMGGIEV